MAHSEFEKKALLTDVEYYALSLVYFGGEKAELIEQVNYYYDTKEMDFQARNTTCRIRQKDNHLTGTIKAHQISNNEHSVEKDFVVDSLPYSFRVGNKFVFLQGEMYTNRLRNNVSDGIMLILDKNIYLGTIDYELEIEYDEDKSQEAQEIFDVVLKLIGKNTENNPQVFSKSQRFFKAKHFLPVKLNLYVSEI